MAKICDVILNFPNTRRVHARLQYAIEPIENKPWAKEILNKDQTELTLKDLHQLMELGGIGKVGGQVLWQSCGKNLVDFKIPSRAKIPTEPKITVIPLEIPKPVVVIEKEIELLKPLAEFIKDVIIERYEKLNRNKMETAYSLGISRAMVYRKLSEYGII